MSPFDSSPSDVLLKWGKRKRSRVSRNLIEDSSSSLHTNQTKKFPDKFSSAIMPPPPLVSSSTTSNARVRKHNNNPRNLEDSTEASRMSSIVSRSAKQKSNRRIPSSNSGVKCDKKKRNVCSTSEAGERLNCHVDSNGEKVSVKVIEWPKIYIALSKKEKEDDFLAMKGTKISQRPKKRAKNIDRTLQCCFPGMWLPNLTKNRYEVREKKSVKKQKCSRGLKGMEGLGSDSE